MKRPRIRVSGVGADGDAVVDEGAEELLEPVGGFEVEGGRLVVAIQQSLLFEGAGDTGGDGVEQGSPHRDYPSAQPAYAAGLY